MSKTNKSDVKVGNLIISVSNATGLVTEIDGKSITIEWTNGTQTNLDKQAFQAMHKFRRWKTEGNDE